MKLFEYQWVKKMMTEQIEGMDYSVDIRFHLFQPLSVSILSSMILLLEFRAFYHPSVSSLSNALYLKISATAGH